MMATDDVHTPYTRKHLFWRVDFNISFDLAGNLAASTPAKRGKGFLKSHIIVGFSTPGQFDKISISSIDDFHVCFRFRFLE